MGLFGFVMEGLRYAGGAFADTGPFSSTSWVPPDTLLPQWLLVEPAAGFEGLDAVVRAVAAEVRVEVPERSIERVGNFLAVVPSRVPDPASLWFFAELASREPRCRAVFLGAYDPGLEVEACWLYRHGALAGRGGQQWRESRAYARHNPEPFSGKLPTDAISRTWPMTHLARLAGLERAQWVEHLTRLSSR